MCINLKFKSQNKTIEIYLDLLVKQFQPFPKTFSLFRGLIPRKLIEYMLRSDVKFKFQLY